ncbi:MAG: hypothetical protein GXO26_00375 [Crenarchaeota archaeon]|nr:hypothetical protein [Thermoproteota archaeon]
MSRVLIYLDYGPSRELVTRIERYLELLEKDNKALISTLPYIVDLDEETKKKIIIKLAEIWARITASTRLAESTVSIIYQYITRSINDKTLMLNIVKEISKIEQIEDLLIMNTLLKIGTGKALPDLGLIALYEDPLSIEQGRRVGRIEISNILVRKMVSLQYESRIMKTIRKLELEIVLCRKKFKSYDNIKIIDWRCLGIYPYSGYTRSISSEGIELAEPVLCAYLRHNVDISTIVGERSSCKVIISHYRIPKISLDYECINNILHDRSFKYHILCLPSSMTLRDRDIVVNFLKSIGIDVHKVLDVPVDVLLDLFPFCNT